MTVPAGIIFLWQGAIGNIPPGYALCNGANGTPDLRDRFVVGAGDTYAVDETGGGTTHDHDFTGDGHAHTIPAGPFITSGPDLDKVTNSVAVTGTTDAGSSLPPYYALAYIMKT